MAAVPIQALETLIARARAEHADSLPPPVLALLEQAAALAARVADPGPLALTVEQVAQELQISRSVAYELVGSGRLPSFKPSPGRVRVARSVLERWIVEQSGPLPGTGDAA